MTDLVFDCVDGQPDRYAAVPTLQLRLRVVAENAVGHGARRGEA